MTKRLLLLTTAMGLILGTAAIAQNSAEPSKTDVNKPAAQQTEKTKPQSRVEKWQADKQTEAAEKSVDKSTGAASANTAQSQTPGSNTNTSAQSQTPASGAAPTTNAQTPTPAPSNGNAANQAQNNPPNSATKTLPNAGAPNAQTQQNQPNQPSQTNTATPQAQPNATPAQAQTPNAAPATNQQAQQPPNNNTQTNNNPATSNTTGSAQTTLSAGVSVTDPQRTQISASVAKLNVQPVTRVNFSVSVGSVVPRDVRLHPVPAEVVQIVPQYRDYRLFVVREEIVIVEPSTMKIVTVLPRNGGSTASTSTSTQTSSTTTQRKSTISDSDRATIKKHASQPRRERTTTIERDDPRSARAESRSSLRVGDRVPESVELHDMPEPAYREAPALREYRYISRGSRTYVIEPRERTIIEELD